MQESSAFSLADRTILVTGASRGIGLAVARACSGAGARVILSARKPEELSQAVEALRAAGGQVWAMPCHMGKPAEVEALFRRVCDEVGAPDGLVNNAATSPHYGALLEATDELIDLTFAVNVKGYLHACRQFVAQRRARGLAGGAIVNLASTSALLGSPGLGAYAMSKAAVLSMTTTLARELGPTGIRVNAISPGLVETRLASALVGDARVHGDWVRRAPLGRHGQPGEIAGMAVYLLSHAAAYVTGQNMVVDGGYTIA